MSDERTFFTLDDILKGTSGVYVRGDRGLFAEISTDTRTIKEGSVFWALRGEKFDGHSYIKEALEKGAHGILIEKSFAGAAGEIASSDVTVVAVEDTLQALQKMASYWRRKHSPVVVAITGSNGKTATKDMAYSIVSRRKNVLKTEGNLNNLIGVPLTLLKLTGSEDTAIIEMGMNAPGEIKRLCEIGKPNFALITNIAPAHLEKLGDIEGVAKAKGEIFESLKDKDMAVVNADDLRILRLAEKIKSRTIQYGIEETAECKRPLDVWAHSIKFRSFDGSSFTLSFKDGESVTVDLPLIGVHQIRNALAASSAAFALGIDKKALKEGLESYKGYRMRMEVVKLGQGVVLVDDSYNANPESMEAALTTVAGLASQASRERKFAVLGEMLELGSHTASLHRRVGAIAAQAGFSLLFVLGEQNHSYARGAMEEGMDAKRIRMAGSHEDLAAEILKEIKGGELVLVKGSRGSRMEKISEEIKKGLPVED